MKWRNAIAILLVTSACATSHVAPVPGLPVNFGVVEEGKLYRGAQPTADEIENLYRRGVKTIVKLNVADLDMERFATGELGIRLMEIPLNARDTGTATSCAQVERAYAAISDPLNWPVYVHCDHGRDRTGFLVGLYRERVEGWTWAQVSDELRRYGHDTAMRIVLPHISGALADHYHVCAGAR